MRTRNATPLYLTLLATVCSLAATPRLARAIEHEPYATVGGGYFGGVARVAVGLGGGAGYRLHVNRALAFYMESRWMLYGGNAFTTSIGAQYTLHVRAWAPAIGLQGTMVFGQQLRVLDASNPGGPLPVGLYVQARIAPLRFEHERFTVAVLVFDAGIGWEANQPAMAISFSLVDVGVRF
jgi:hypothetical protein